MTKSIEHQLARVPMLAGLPADALSRLARSASVVVLASGDELFREGDSSDDCYLVLQGEVEALKAADTAEASTLGISGAGEFVGEMSLLNRDGLRTATVRALSAACLLRIPMEEFNELVSRSPLFSHQLVGVLSARLTKARDDIVRRLSEKNRQLQRAYDELQSAQDELIDKRAMEHELLLARDIQRSILPTRVPDFAGYDFGGLTIPARTVGGDFFGWFPLDRQRMALVIGDVMGKGAASAIFMAQTYALLRASAGPDLSPGDVLRRVNRLLLDMSDSGLFTTMIYGIQHAATGRWDYARAGHELPLVMSATGETRFAPMQGGMPLGILDDPELDENHLELQPGELLLLYTDGVTDGTDLDGEHFDQWRLEAAVRATLGQDAEHSCQSILKAVTAFQQGETQFDDITLLAVRRAAALR